MKPNPMTQTYSQLQKQIEALQRQAESVRDIEVKGVVQRIKVAIAQYNLTAAQLGLGSDAAGRGKAARGPNSSLARSAKFADGNGNIWSGRGPHPHWLRDALNAGKSLEEFATGGVPAKATRGKAKVTGKRKAKSQYRDQAGNSWSGFGPRPRWLREAIESGKTLEQFAA
jgi:DNA-binding protein H-NS